MLMCVEEISSWRFVQRFFYLGLHLVACKLNLYFLLSFDSFLHPKSCIKPV